MAIEPNKSKKKKRKVDKKELNKQSTKLNVEQEEKKEINLWWRPYWTWKYTPEELKEKFEEYVKLNEEDLVENLYWKMVKAPLLLTGFAIWLWVGKNYISEKENVESFKGVIKYIKSVIENDVARMWIMWVYNPTLTSKFLAANCWWVEKREIENTWESDREKAKLYKDMQSKVKKLSWEEVSWLLQDMLNNKK